jgi:lysophospholipase L1-like esterase
VLRLAVLGSSGTYGYRIPRHQTWPAALQALCRERGHAVEVGNFASPGLPLAAYAERLAHLRDAWRPHAALIQLPLYSRTYLGLNGTGRLSEAGGAPWKAFGWTGPCDATTAVAPTRIHLNRLLAVPGSPFFHLLEPWFYPRVRENNPGATWEGFLAFARFWADNVAESELQHVQHGKEIVLLQLLLERWKLPYLMFDWHGYNSRRDPALGPFGQEIDFSRYVERGARTATGFVEALGRDELFVDGHGHLSAAGHQALARGFLLPPLLSLIRPPHAKEERDDPVSL